MQEQLTLQIRNYSYHLINLTDKQNIVIQAIRRLQPCTNQQIANYLEYPINRVTGRTNELLKKKAIKTAGFIRGEFGKPNTLFELTEV